MHMCNARPKIIMVSRTKQEQMNLKFGKTIRTLRLSQNYLVLIKIKSVSDKHAKQATLFDSPQHGLLIFRLEAVNKKPLFTKPAST